MDSMRQTKEKKDEKHFRGLKIHFTMILGKIYIFSGFCILQLRKKEPRYLKLTLPTVNVFIYNFEESVSLWKCSSTVIF